MVITSIAAGEEKPYQGSTVRVLLEDTPWHRNIESAIPKFQEQTGISVFMEFLPSESERERTNSVSYTHLDVYKRQLLKDIVRKMATIMH